MGQKTVTTGRPREHFAEDQSDPLDKYEVRLSARQAIRARRAGDTNLSKGIRAMIEFAIEFGDQFKIWSLDKL